MALFLVPTFLLFRRSILRSASALYGCAVMVLFGFVANRLNVSVTGIEAGSGTSYVPKWTEIVVTLALVALGFAIFRFACQHLPIFVTESPAEGRRVRVPISAPGD
jgi:Ni/Fe-hydrogenase subunit HybB-like protein